MAPASANCASTFHGFASSDLQCDATLIAHHLFFGNNFDFSMNSWQGMEIRITFATHDLRLVRWAIHYNLFFVTIDSVLLNAQDSW